MTWANNLLNRYRAVKFRNFGSRLPGRIVKSEIRNTIFYSLNCYPENKLVKITAVSHLLMTDKKVHWIKIKICLPSGFVYYKYTYHTHAHLLQGTGGRES